MKSSKESKKIKRKKGKRKNGSRRGTKRLQYKTKKGRKEGMRK